MIDAPLALAFGAGLVATMNPCGFAMLPAYLSYFIGTGGDEDASKAEALRRALVVGGVMALAFLTVFGTAGILITAGFRAVIDWIPYIALVIGVLVAGLGVAMLLGYEFTVSLPKASRSGKGRGLRRVYGFGISYALASLSCTLPVFLSVVAGQVTRTDFASGVVTFVVYGLGMSLMLMSITLAMALGRRTIIARLRSSARYINRVSGAILVAAGAYIVWIWATSLASGADALGDSGAFRFVESLSQRAVEIFGERPALWALLLGGVVVGTIIYVLLQTEEPGDEPPSGDPEQRHGAHEVGVGATD
jgi:cytochrome c biogenesis protein CcdA